MGFLAKRSNPSVVCFATTDPNAKYANDHIYDDDGICSKGIASPGHTARHLSGY